MAIPEFILRKMLVPNSYHYDRSRFRFMIENNYAAGTITTLKLIADGLEIPSNQVEYRVTGQSPKNAGHISTSSPAPIPTGVQIEISGTIAARPKRLVLWANTKEAGIIQFTVFTESKTVRHIPAWMTALRKPVHARLIIELDSAIELSNSLPLERDPSVVYTDINGLARVGPPLLDWHLAGFEFNSPSGVEHGTICFPAINPFSDGNTGGEFAFDTLLKRCQNSRSQIYWVLDGNSASPASLSRWLSNDNHALIYSPYVIISGNAWQRWDLSAESATVYGRKVSRLAQVLHAYDPKIQVGMLCKSLDGSEDEELCIQWNERAFSEAGDNIDFVFWQLMPFEIPPEGLEMPPMNIFESCASHIVKMGKAISRIHAQLSSCISGRQIPQAVDLSGYTRSLASQLENRLLTLAQNELEIINLKSLAVLFEHSDELLFACVDEPDSFASHCGQFNPLTAHSADPKVRTLILHPIINTADNSSDSNQDSDSQCLSAFLIYSPEHEVLEMTLANLDPQRPLKVYLSSQQMHIASLREQVSGASSIFLSRSFGWYRATIARSIMLQPRSCRRFSVTMK